MTVTPRKQSRIAELRTRLETWKGSHNAAVCAVVGLVACATVLGLFAFMAFSGMGASVDFIYNQF